MTAALATTLALLAAGGGCWPGALASGHLPWPELEPPPSTEEVHIDPIRGIVCDPGYAWDCEWAIRVVDCESRNQPEAVGQEWYRGQLWYFVGLWQIASEYIDDALFDPRVNTDRAYAKWLSGGVGHWPLCG